MNKITDVIIAELLQETRQNLTTLKKKKPHKYKIIKFGAYVDNANISEEELIKLIDIHTTMKNNILQAQKYLS